jgi:RNA ligase
MIKFSHIEQFHDVVRIVAKRREAGLAIKRVAYRGRIKLHGSNASVVSTGDELLPQSRNRELTLDDDNLGFAAFALTPARTPIIRTLALELRATVQLAPDRPLVLFGEWVGPGVQKGVAVSKLPTRQWVLFAAATLDDGALHKRYFEVPQLGERFADAGIYSIADAPEQHIEIDFSDRDALEHAAASIHEATLEVERGCPWGARFQVAGVGEGLVWQPLGEHFGDSELFFKTKGEQHQVVRRTEPRVAVDPEVLASVDAFLTYALTEPRLAQGLEVLREQGLELELRNLGAFLKWVASDVRRECATELEANNLEWKAVAKLVNERAKAYFVRALPSW